MNRSHELFIQAQQSIPGGVNSPVRAFQAVGGDPLFIARAEGACLYDADGRRYIDYVGSWGPMILGHADPDVIAGAGKRAGVDVAAILAGARSPEELDAVGPFPPWLAADVPAADGGTLRLIDFANASVRVTSPANSRV